MRGSFFDAGIFHASLLAISDNSYVIKIYLNNLRVVKPCISSLTSVIIYVTTIICIYAPIPSLPVIVRGFFDAAYCRFLFITFTTKPISKVCNYTATDDWRNDVYNYYLHIQHLLPSKLSPEVKATSILYHQ